MESNPRETLSQAYRGLRHKIKNRKNGKLLFPSIFPNQVSTICLPDPNFLILLTFNIYLYLLKVFGLCQCGYVRGKSIIFRRFT
jgi:hypothetical protein